jgi:putative transposase
MPMPPLPLTALSEAQRTQANARFAIIRSPLETGVTQVQVARKHERWIKNYREKGLTGLANASPFRQREVS